jgi:hypothetical protein
MTYYPNRTSFSCSGIRSSFNTSTPDSFSTKDNSSPINTPHQLILDQSFRHNPLFTYSFDTDSTVQTSDWHMFPVQNHTAGLLRKGEGHHRNVSESTVNSTGPSSPFMQGSTYPYIANADQSPTTSYFSDNDQTFNNVGYAPSKLSHTPAEYGHRPAQLDLQRGHSGLCTLVTAFSVKQGSRLTVDASAEVEFRP